MLWFILWFGFWVGSVVGTWIRTCCGWLCGLSAWLRCALFSCRDVGFVMVFSLCVGVWIGFLIAVVTISLMWLSWWFLLSCSEDS